MQRSDRESRIAHIAVLEQPLRQDIYALLLERDDWLGRDEVAQTLDLPRSVVAFHLDKMAEVGLVEVRFERLGGRTGPGAGRPAKLYRRSRDEVSVSLPDRRYDLAGALLADAVTDATATGRPVDAALAEAARRAGREIGEAVREETQPGRSVGATIGAAKLALERLGYEPREQDGDIVLANCPFHSLVERHTALVCTMNLDLLQGVAEGVDAAERLAPRLEPTEGLCCVRLRGSRPSSGRGRAGSG